MKDISVIQTNPLPYSFIKFVATLMKYISLNSMLQILYKKLSIETKQFYIF